MLGGVEKFGENSFYNFDSSINSFYTQKGIKHESTALE